LLRMLPITNEKDDIKENVHLLVLTS
jgi:hypothetical protein